jgi:hypothetical protein
MFEGVDAEWGLGNEVAVLVQELDFDGAFGEGFQG